MKQTEALIQSSIVKPLRKYPGVTKCFAIANEAAGRSKIMQMQLVTMGLLAGVSDIEIWLENGYTVYMEVKAPKGKQSQNQIRFEESIRSEPFRLYCIVHSWDEAKKYIDMALNFPGLRVGG